MTTKTVSFRAPVKVVEEFDKAAKLRGLSRTDLLVAAMILMIPESKGRRRADVNWGHATPAPQVEVVR